MKKLSKRICVALVFPATGVTWASPIEFTDSGQSIGSSSGFSIGASLGDLDNDGDLDAFVTRVFGTDGIEVWLNDGTGQFELSNTFATGEFRDEAVIGDFDQDGDLDALVTNNSERELWLNDGVGNFSLQSTVTGAGGVTRISVADLDGDGDPDVLTSGFATEIILNQSGDLSQITQTIPGVGSWSALGDVDGDGDLDAYIACNCRDIEKLLLNDGSGFFTDSGQTLTDGSSTAAFGQFDNNDGIDVITNSSAGLGFVANDGTGLLSEPVFDRSIRSTFGIATGDLDSDGDTDAFLTTANGGFDVVSNNGLGEFTSDQQQSGRSAHVALGDLDGDGDLDAYLTLFGASDQVWYNTTEVTLATDTDGDGIADTEDTDDDNDGVLDVDDAFPLDDTESLDTDIDGIGNNTDTDDDNDGVLDVDDAFPLDDTESVNTDGDALGNNADPDDDNDGVLDIDDVFPLDASESADDDLDTIGNNLDNCPAMANTNQADADEDGIGDACEADTDGDTIIDDIDNCPAMANANQADEDQNGIGDACEASSATGNIDAANSVNLNSWNTGFNATYEYTVQESDTLGGTLREWKIDIVPTDPVRITNAWVNSGYNAAVSLTGPINARVFTNEGKSYVDELTAGDVIRFTVQGIGSGFESDSLTLNFESLSQTLPATGECASPIAVTLPFSFDGAGEHCWEVSGTVSHTNSWNTESVSINGESFTNRWSNSLPPAVDGKLVILYEGAFPWSHFEISGNNN